MGGPIGRGIPYSREVMDRIYARMAGGESIKDICDSADMPNARTVREWIVKYPDEGPQYARARDLQAEAMADEILKISDDSTGDTYTVIENGREVTKVDQENINRSRLRVDSRKWLLSKMSPRKYGDRVEVEHSGTVNTGMTVTVNVIPAKPEPAPIDVEPEKPALPPDSKICGE